MYYMLIKFPCSVYDDEYSIGFDYHHSHYRWIRNILFLKSDFCTTFFFYSWEWLKYLIRHCVTPISFHNILWKNQARNQSGQTKPYVSRLGSWQCCTLKIEISDCNEFGFYGQLLDVYRKIFLTSLITS